MFNTKDFTFNPKTKTLVAELSDFHPDRVFGMYLAIKSHHTNRTETFIFMGYQRNSDDEVEALIYKPDATNLNVDKVLLFND